VSAPPLGANTYFDRKRNFGRPSFIRGVRNDEQRDEVSLYLGLTPRLFEPFLKEYLIVIQAILITSDNA